MKKKSYWFPHDTEAMDDEKCQILRAKSGAGGYGIYWYFLEKMHKEGGRLRCDSLEMYAFSFNVDITLLILCYNTCLSAELFVTDNVFFWSERVLKNIASFEDARALKSKAGSIGMLKRWGSRNSVMQKNNNVITADNTITYTSDADASFDISTKTLDQSTFPATKFASVLKNTELLKEKNQETLINTSETGCDSKIMPTKPAVDRKKTKKVRDTQREVIIPETLSASPLFIKTWADWLQHLAEKKSKPTPSALEKQLKLCEALGLDDAVKTIERSIQNNWQGIFPQDERSKNSIQGKKSIFQILKERDSNGD